MDRRSRDFTRKLITDVSVYSVIISLGLGSFNIITTDTGTRIWMGTAAFFFSCSFVLSESLFGKFWDSRERPKTKVEEFFDSLEYDNEY